MEDKQIKLDSIVLNEVQQPQEALPNGQENQGQKQQFKFDIEQQPKQDLRPSSIRFHPSSRGGIDPPNSPKLVKTDQGIKQNEILFTEHSFPRNKNSQVVDAFLDKYISIKCLKIQRMEYFIQQLQLQLLREKLKKDFLNEVVFFLEVHIVTLKGNNEQTYRIRRVYQDFKNLDKNLQKEFHKKKIDDHLPEFPYQKDPKNIFDKEVFLKIGEYMSKLTEKSKIIDTDTFWQFFEISTNFYPGVIKVKETFIKKRSGGRFKTKCITSCNMWSVRYLAITSEGLMYSRGNRGQENKIREILMFDQNFNMEYGKIHTGKDWGIAITVSTRRIFLECYSQFHFYDVLAAFKEAISLSPYIEIHRFDSFAPERKDAECKWFVDGSDYFTDLYQNLIKAKSSVYITDWWLSPELYLLRPVSEDTNQESRIDQILKNLGERGVNIFIILYKEPTIALTLDSQYTKHYLKSLSKNIVIMRHPDTLLPFLWSHHEKMVLIDQQIGYIGGLDLCYGRFDTKDHLLTDLPVQQPNGQPQFYFPGIDYSNSRTKDFDNVKNYTVSNIDRYKQIRMPWHDVHMKVMGEPVKDMVRHFIQYWNFSKVDIYSKKKKSQIAHLVPEKEKQVEQKKGFGPQISKIKTKFQSAFLSIKSKVKSKLQRLDSQEKQNNIQMQNETMKGQPRKSRFLIFLDELKKTPATATKATNESNIPQVSIKMYQTIASEQVEETDNNYVKRDSNNIQNSSNVNQQSHNLKIEALGKLQQSKYDNSRMSPNTANQSKHQFQAEIVMDNSDLFEKKVREIKRTQTNLVFNIEQNSELSSEKGQHRNSGQSFENKFSNFKAMKQSLTDNIFEKIQSDVIMDDIEEFNVGEASNQLVRYQSLQPHYSKLNKKDSKEIAYSVEPADYSKKESKTLKKIIGGKSKVSSHLRSLGNGIDLLEKINLLNTENEEINFFQHKNGIPTITADLQVSEILDKVEPLQNSERPITKSTSLWKTKVQDKVLNKKSLFTSQAAQMNDYEQIEKSKINLNYINYSTTGSCKCQMLRSGSSWSLGLKPDHTEMSIQIAYIQLITQAQHFIYIENQFFISCTAGNVVKNQIAQALIDRIIAADKKGENFFVCVVMPLLPGFAGEVNDSNAAVMKCQLHWEYYTISRGGGSIFEVLKQHVSDPFKYIRFFGLRNHGPYSEIIYVHSKLMIVDDRFVILGSANINDRSMLGTRDSEIAMLVEDTKRVSAKMNGKYVMISEFGHTLRKSLYQEHFGLTDEEADDPLNQEHKDLISERAKLNTEIYREVFRCYPDDQLLTINQLDGWQKEKKPENYHQLKQSIIGHAVELPLDFLKNEKLNFTISQKEYYVPVQSFLQMTWKVIQNSFTFFFC